MATGAADLAGLRRSGGVNTLCGGAAAMRGDRARARAGQKSSDGCAHFCGSVAAGLGCAAAGLAASGGAGLAAAGLTAAGAAGNSAAFLVGSAGGLAAFTVAGAGAGGGGGGAFLRRLVASARGWIGCDLSTFPGQALSNAVPLPQPRGHLKPVLRFLATFKTRAHARAECASATPHCAYRASLTPHAVAARTVHSGCSSGTALSSLGGSNTRTGRR